MNKAIDIIIEVWGAWIDAVSALFTNTLSRWWDALFRVDVLIFSTPGTGIATYFGQFLLVVIEELNKFTQRIANIPLETSIRTAAEAIPLPDKWSSRVIKGDDAFRALVFTLSAGAWEALNLQLPLAYRVGQWLSSRFSTWRLILKGISRLTITKKIADAVVLAVWTLFGITLRVAGTIAVVLILVWLAGKLSEKDNFIEKLFLQQNNKLVKDTVLGRKRISSN